MKQKMQVRERIVDKIQHTSVDLIDYRWIRMVQACFKAVSDLFRTCLDWFQTRLKSLRDFYIYILPALHLSGFYILPVLKSIQRPTIQHSNCKLNAAIVVWEDLQRSGK